MSDAFTSTLPSDLIDQIIVGISRHDFLAMQVKDMLETKPNIAEIKIVPGTSDVDVEVILVDWDQQTEREAKFAERWLKSEYGLTVFFSDRYKKTITLKAHSVKSDAMPQIGPRAFEMLHDGSAPNVLLVWYIWIRNKLNTAEYTTGFDWRPNEETAEDKAWHDLGGLNGNLNGVLEDQIIDDATPDQILETVIFPWVQKNVTPNGVSVEFEPRVLKSRTTRESNARIEWFHVTPPDYGQIFDSFPEPVQEWLIFDEDDETVILAVEEQRTDLIAGLRDLAKSLVAELQAVPEFDWRKGEHTGEDEMWWAAGDGSGNPDRKR